MAVMDALLIKTMAHFLEGIAAELSRNIDWRAVGRGRGVLRRAWIYTVALLRDLVRIPLHHPEGIAQARFRARVKFITENAIPTLRFFVVEYPLDQARIALLGEAIDELQRGADLITDGPIRDVDDS
jgi:hypothetical protein